MVSGSFKSAGIANRAKPSSAVLKNVEGYAYIIPQLLCALAFGYYPFMRTAAHSFSLVNARSAIVGFAGFENFVRLFADDKFLQALGNTLKYVVLEIPASLLLAILLAMLANKRRPFSRVYQTLFTMPMAISMSITCLMFRELLEPNMGMINYLVQRKIFWLDDPVFAMSAIVVMVAWTSIGLPFMLLLASLRAVPQELVENAELSGAGVFKTLRYVYIPLISPTLFFLICTKIASTMTMVTPVLMLTGGGPFNSTSTLVHYIYNAAFQSRDYSISGAGALVTFVMTFGMLLINFIYEKRGVYYE